MSEPTTATFYQVTLKFNQNLALEIAKQIAEMGAMTNLSFSVGDGIFDKQVIAIIAYPVEKQDTVTAKFHKYIKS